jgi:hypothetical protein
MLSHSQTNAQSDNGGSHASHISLPSEIDVESVGQEHTRPLADQGVDISRAEHEFFEFSQQLRRRSAAEAWNNASGETIAAAPTLPTSTSDPTVDVDIEKAEKAAQSEGGFDLREYLTSSNDAYQQAGIKHKVRMVSLKIHI